METAFRGEQHKTIRDTIRNRVERHGTGMKIRAEQLEQAAIKERKAEQLFDEVKRLQGESIIVDSDADSMSPSRRFTSILHNVPVNLTRRDSYLNSKIELRFGYSYSFVLIFLLFLSNL